MGIEDSADLTRQLEGVLSLAGRRAGHATMARLLHELDRRGRSGAVPADLEPRRAHAVAQLVVGQELARLPGGWAVLHAVPTGADTALDHLVVGPAGVVVIAAVPRRIDGVHEDPAVRDLLRRADLVRRALGADLAVRALPVVVDVAVDGAAPRRTGPRDVRAVRADDLVRHLLALRPVLTPAQVRQVHGGACRPRTWGVPASVLHEPDPTMRFLALQAPSRTARARPPHPDYEHRARRVRARPRNGAACRQDRDERAHRRALQLLLAIATAALAPLAALVGAGVAAALLTP